MVRAATKEDLSRIAEIGVYGWRNAYRGIIDDAELFARRQVGTSIERFSRALGDPAVTILVYEDRADGIVKGMAGFGEARDGDAVGAFELYHVYVETAFARGGVGRALLGRFEEEARARGKRVALVWVLEDNLRGRRFYESQGYRLDGGRKALEDSGPAELRYRKDLSSDGEGSARVPPAPRQEGIRYVEGFSFSRDAIFKLYEGAGWSEYLRDREALWRGLRGSLSLQVAHAGAELVGFARSVGDGGTVCIVQDLLVDARHRGRGIGRELLRRLLESSGPARQTIVLFDRGEGLEEFYAKAGFATLAGQGMACAMRTM